MMYEEARRQHPEESEAEILARVQYRKKHLKRRKRWQKVRKITPLGVIAFLLLVIAYLLLR